MCFTVVFFFCLCEAPLICLERFYINKSLLTLLTQCIEIVILIATCARYDRLKKSGSTSFMLCHVLSYVYILTMVNVAKVLNNEGDIQSENTNHCGHKGKDMVNNNPQVDCGA